MDTPDDKKKSGSSVISPAAMLKQFINSTSAAPILTPSRSIFTYNGRPAAVTGAPIAAGGGQPAQLLSPPSRTVSGTESSSSNHASPHLGSARSSAAPSPLSSTRGFGAAAAGAAAPVPSAERSPLSSARGSGQSSVAASPRLPAAVGTAARVRAELAAAEAKKGVTAPKKADPHLSPLLGSSGSGAGAANPLAKSGTLFDASLKRRVTLVPLKLASKEPDLVVDSNAVDLSPDIVAGDSPNGTAAPSRERASTPTRFTSS